MQGIGILRNCFLVLSLIEDRGAYRDASPGFRSCRKLQALGPLLHFSWNLHLFVPFFLGSSIPSTDLAGGGFEGGGGGGGWYLPGGGGDWLFPGDCFTSIIVLAIWLYH